MAKVKKTAIEKWENLKSKGIPASEHLLNIIKAGLSAAPFTGAISSLMTDYIPTERAKRLEEFAETIANDLVDLQDKVVAENLTTDSFAFMFEKCFRGVAENYQKEKIDAFRGILVNSAIGTKLSENEKEYFLNLATNLTTLHIRILRFMATPESYLSAYGISPAKITGGFSNFFPIAIPGIPIDVIRSAFGELYRYGFISTDQGIFGTMTSGQGLQLLRGRVTALGQNFINFCSVPQ